MKAACNDCNQRAGKCPSCLAHKPIFQCPDAGAVTTGNAAIERAPLRDPDGLANYDKRPHEPTRVPREQVTIRSYDDDSI